MTRYTIAMLPGSRQAYYHSYLLRLWRDDDFGPWMASLHNTGSGEMRTFADLDSLWAFLLQQVDIGENPPRPEEASS